MSALAEADRTRLAQMLGLLGSDHAGERDAAGLAAHRLIRQRGLTWLDIIAPAPSTHAGIEPEAPAKPPKSIT